MERKCDRCKCNLTDTESVLLEVPGYSPTGYPEDASWEEIELCQVCYIITSEGLDQRVEP